MSKRRRAETEGMSGKVARPRCDAGPFSTAATDLELATEGPAAASMALPTLPLNCPDLAVARLRGIPVVDKTGAIADLLNYGDDDAHRVFFVRPRNFGKSVTLSTAAEILAAGALPAGVKPWPGFSAVDVDSVFGGTEVHRRLAEAPSELRGLLQEAHFVIKLRLGGVLTGAKLAAGITEGVARIAADAFCDKELTKAVREASTPADAVLALVNAVPAKVPVALLVDEYDHAIIRDVTDGLWASAKEGVKALQSLVMTTKAPDMGSRIKRCLVTGVVRISLTSHSSGASDFSDLTADPLLSRVLGFTREEVRASFPGHLRRLAKRGLGSTSHKRRAALDELQEWYGGYCFDGETSCLNPHLVLSALSAGSITVKEMDAASTLNWLGLGPGDVLMGTCSLAGGMPGPTASVVDLSGPEKGSVHTLPLVLQTGMLSLVPGSMGSMRAPNGVARRSMERVLTGALAV